MAELYSDFLFNPLGSSRAPPPQASLLPKFPCPRPRSCQAPGQEQPLGNGFAPGLLFRRVPNMLELERSKTPRSVLRSLGTGRAMVCRDAVDPCYTPVRIQGPWSTGQGCSNSPLLPGEWETLLLSSSFLPSSVLWSDGCLECALLKPEEGGVALAAPGSSLNRLGWFSVN